MKNFSKALKDFKSGKIVIIADDEDRESEGDFVCAASLCKAEHVNFMVTHGKGLVCAAITEERALQLSLPMMSQRNSSRFETAFTVSIEARHGTTTGISAAERALTCRTLADRSKHASDFICPGHIFPLVAKEHGVLQRNGHTEAAIDLCRISKLPQTAVICEILNPDGTMARMPDLKKIAKKHNLTLITVQDLINYRLATELLVERVAEPLVPTKHGNFKAIAYRNKINNEEYVVFTNLNAATKNKSVNVRIHSECLTGDIFHSLKCDCGEQLDYSMSYIAKNGGVLIYARGQEGRGIGLINKLRAYELQEQGLDTVEANIKLGFKPDQRNYAFIAHILKELDIKSVNLLTNNPRKIAGIELCGIKIAKRIPVEMKANEHNKKYLTAKKKRMGHLL
ncbi:MAG: 3,4-dihydroxy-2-butanone-4-phosphate synthase [Fibromonadaceae bacterium]|jgi:3,4-dihydroxy 2-butanone 4-phosphate synthase/GTP cyclohydrolase II|nr:3,4-dihydroxy-2-butanone-4-phosphate synthase [Fibromonadaceae bacterium]